LEATFDRVELAGAGSVDLLGPVFDGKLDVNAPLVALSDFVPDLPTPSGDLSLSVQVAGTIDEPRGSGRVVIDQGRIGDYGFGDRVTADFSADLQTVILQKVVLELGPGIAEVKGKLLLDEHLTFSAESVGTDVSLGRVLDSIAIEGPWVDLVATGKSSVAGTLSPVSLDGPFDYAVQDLIVYDRAFNSPELIDQPRALLPPDVVMLAPAPVRVSGRWHFDADGAVFKNAKIVGERTDAVVDAKIQPGKGVDVQVAFSKLDFADIGPIGGLVITGSGSLVGTLGGSFETLGAEGLFELSGISFGGVPLGDTAKGRIVWHDFKNLDVPEVTGVLGKSKFEGRVGAKIEGEVPLSISGSITDGQLPDLLIPFHQTEDAWGRPKGKMRATFDLQGSVKKLTGPVSLDLKELVVFDEKAETGRIDGRFEDGKIIAEHLEIDKHGGRIVGSGFLDPNGGGVGLTLRTVGSRLEHLEMVKLGTPLLKGDLEMHVDLRGTLAGVTGTVAARLADIKAGPLGLGDAAFAGKLDGATLSFDGGLDDRRLLATGTLRLVSGLPYKTTLTFAELDAFGIVSGLQGHQRWSGPLVATAQLDGALSTYGKSSGTIQLERAELIGSSFRIATSAPARFTLREGVLETKRLGLAGPRTRLLVEGRVGAEVMDLKVDGRVDLALVELTSPSVEKAGGVLLLDGAVRGAPSAMNLVGTGRVEGGLLEWRGIESRFTGMTADLTFSQSSVLIERSEVKWAGGTLAATGNVLLEALLPKNISLEIAVHQVRPRLALPTVDLSALLDGTLEVTGTMEHLSTRGELKVERGLARPKIDAQSLVGRPKIPAAYDPAAERLDFDIGLRTAEPFRVKNDDMDFELNGEVRLTGTNERFGMLGAMTASPGGRASFLGREYTIQNGILELTDRYRFATRYDLTFDAEACAARIRLNLVGTLDSVETNATSNPEMSDADILSCLIRGVKTRNLDQDLASFAGSALLKLSGVDQQVKRVIPVDQIDVTTEFSSQSRAYEPRVLVAKDLSLLNRPVRLEYSTALIRTNDQRAALRVRLTPRLNLQLGWTSSEDVPYGDWGLDLKQRWEW
jgi:autotransporter translocation and assembly factor TamB